MINREVDHEKLITALADLRIKEPDLPALLARTRKRRSRLTTDGHLVIIAADHPARRVVAAGQNPWAMADRAELLKRLAAVLQQPGVDGVLATPDLLEELLLYNYWLLKQGEKDFLEEKLLIGSMNRGGLAGTVFELYDPVTAYTARDLLEMNLDGGKLLFQFDPQARESGQTLYLCAAALRELADQRLPAFLEVVPRPPTTDELVLLVGVATALGPTSSHLWLKLPMVEGFERVARATTCPILVLGGSEPGNSSQLLSRIESCLKAGPNIRGAIIGRGILYPSDDSDPAQLAAQLAQLIHQSTSQRSSSDQQEI
ncbi:Cgl0159 family (beta/alpha)8-fold protein [Thermogemmatispora tikiterensis]|uniref:Cgl0159-like domain-containing protein n=1 Tax=Thermogemmatispora tikiterensis TaxID=1825093 RepID=A0A328VID6_9CHLR|nr:hypothetical protein [Thermogemmatispora tikiterensis]RAQ95862.1 hypothetical protein A4R35_09965 [Thermogemmatispora tikiterensis]